MKKFILYFSLFSILIMASEVLAVHGGGRGGGAGRGVGVRRGVGVGGRGIRQGGMGRGHINRGNFAGRGGRDYYRGRGVGEGFVAGAVLGAAANDGYYGDDYYDNGYNNNATVIVEDPNDVYYDN